MWQLAVGFSSANGSDAADLLENLEWRPVVPEVPNVNLSGATYGSGQWVAVGELGSAAVSNNGQDWVRVLTGLFTDMFDVAYGDGQYVAVGSEGVTLVSTNGFDWQTNSATFTNELRLVEAGPSQFVAGGPDGTLAVSGDGRNWQVVTNLGAVADIRHGDGTFVVAAGQSSDDRVRVFSSTDGTNWLRLVVNDASGASFFTNGAATSVTYGNGLWMVSLHDHFGLRFLRSTKLSDWYGSRPEPGSWGDSGHLEFGGGMFRSYYGHHTFVRYSVYHASTNGIDWEMKSFSGTNSGPTYLNFSHVEMAGSDAIFFSAGSSSLLERFRKLRTHRSHSPEIVRLPEKQPATVELNYPLILQVGYDGGEFWYSARTSTNYSLHHSPDGIRWRKGLMTTNGFVTSIIPGVGKLYAMLGDKILVTTNRTEWTELETYPAPTRYYNLTGGDGWLMVPKSDRVFCTTDGENWNELSFPPGHSFRGAAYSEGRFVVLTEFRDTAGNTVGFSWVTTDCTNWNGSYQHEDFGTWSARGFKSAFGRFFFVARWNRMFYSADGLSWDQTTNIGMDHPSDVLFTGTHYLFFGEYSSSYNDARIWAWDPATDERVGRVFSLPNLFRVAYDGHRFVSGLHQRGLAVSNPIDQPFAGTLSAESGGQPLLRFRGKAHRPYRLEMKHDLDPETIWKTMGSVTDHGGGVGVPVANTNTAAFIRAVLESN